MPRCGALLLSVGSHEVRIRSTVRSSGRVGWYLCCLGWGPCGTARSAYRRDLPLSKAGYPGIFERPIIIHVGQGS